MFTWRLPFLLHLHTGHVCTVELQVPHTHRCRHGSSSTPDSSFPQLLHHLLSFTTFANMCLSPPPSELLPQEDSASLSASHRPRSPLTWARTCSRLHRSVLAVASLVWARSRHIWFSMERLFTFSSNAQFSFSIFSISSSLVFKRFIMPSSTAVMSCWKCLFRLSASSLLTFSVCNFFSRQNSVTPVELSMQNA